MADVRHAYFAGLFDGEGHVELRVLGDRGCPRRIRLWLHVSNKDLRPLRALVAEYGGSLTLRPSTEVWAWRIGAKGGERFARDILPYVIIKRDELEVWLEARALVKPWGGGARVSEEEWEERQGLEARVFELRSSRDRRGQRRAS